MKSLSSITRVWAGALALSAFGAFMAAGAQAATVLSSQAPNPIGASYLSIDTTQNAETFTLGESASITGFRWYGTTLDNLGEFTVRLYDSSLASAPDTFTLLTGPLLATPTRSDAPVFIVGTGPLAVPIFEYELTLASAVAAVANLQYSVAIFSTGDLWGWQDSVQGDGISYFRGADTTPWQSLPPDLSLAVIGEPDAVGVPEPTSLALVGLALAAAGAIRRRVV